MGKHDFETFQMIEVVLVANSLPALNDVTAMELPDIVAEAAKINRQSLANNFEYVMYGKIYRITEGSGREKALKQFLFERISVLLEDQNKKCK
ncbi:hypothetical protein Fmac_026215 [Flemingia macrophylla]|uniref:Uncharacterized protein n=1 Tax=Flemingia macrophylla TaxID=520843 RepID=A0ABD1LE79_9FABA